MINLEKVSGLPISVDDNYQLIFRNRLPAVKPNIRKLSEMIPVLMEPEIKPVPYTKDMYYMYRDIHMLNDELAKKFYIICRTNKGECNVINVVF